MSEFKTGDTVRNIHSGVKGVVTGVDKNDPLEYRQITILLHENGYTARMLERDCVKVKVVKLTPEQRKKISDAVKRRFEQPGAREKHSEICKRACSTPEQKAKRAAPFIRYWKERKESSREVSG